KMATKEFDEALGTIRRFLDATGNKWEWGDFLTERPQDPRVLDLRGFCQSLASEFPPSDPTEYCNARGMRMLEDAWSTLNELEEEPTREELAVVLRGRSGERPDG